MEIVLLLIVCQCCEMADHQNDQGSWSGSNYSSSSSITSFINIIHNFIVKIILTLIIGTSPDLTLGIDVIGVHACELDGACCEILEVCWPNLSL